jgi:hypothetical protein
VHVFLPHGRELEEDRPQPLTEGGDASAEDAREADAVEGFRGVRQSTVGLHAEPKA